MYPAVLLVMVLRMFVECAGTNACTPPMVELVGEHRVRERRGDEPPSFNPRSTTNRVRANVWCDFVPLCTPPAPPVDSKHKWNEVTRVVLIGCKPPEFPDPPAFSDVLADRGLRPSSPDMLELIEVPENARFNASHFAGLDSLTRLTVQAVGTKRPQQLSPDVMESLLNLIRLTLENEALPPLPEKTRIRFAQLERGRSLGAWGGCKELVKLYLSDWFVPVEREWLVHCKNLYYLAAERMERASLLAVLHGLGAGLKELMLPYNELTTPDLAAALRYSTINLHYLQVLRVPHNNITHIDGSVLDKMKNLELLDLSHNMLSDLPRIMSAVSGLGQSLHTLMLGHNPLRAYCTKKDDSLVFSGQVPLMPYLQTISLAGTNSERLCFSNWTPFTLLNLSNNNIEELQFRQLPLVDNMELMTVDLRRNPLRDIQFDESAYRFLNNSKRRLVKVYTDLLSLDCKCRGRLAHLLEKSIVLVPFGATCTGGGRLQDVPRTDLECDLVPCKPCYCQREWATRTLRVYCEARGLQALPKLPDLGQLHLRGNNIHTIQAEDLTKTLTLLDVRDNNVTRVDVATVAALFEVLERHVWFSGNPLACECNNWSLLGALQEHHLQVDDYENVTCSDGRALQNLNEEQLCGVWRDVWPAVTAASGVLVGLVVLLGALYLRYERPLKVWLYARGFCLRCVREEELDADREYDVFLSYAHGDHEFVAEKLLPGLEGGRCHYRVCVHYRDWTPGELISTQISRSVAASRRTVIVLSAHFVQSMWGILEFRTAHVSALAEGRLRVLVVVLDSTPPIDELPEELRLYLRSTTYLCWNDTWFWDKFRYALPHRAARDMQHDMKSSRTQHSTNQLGIQ